MFIIGHLRGQRTGKVFPITGENGNTIKVVGRLDWIKNDFRSRVYAVDGVSPTLTTMQGGYSEPKVLVNVDREKLKAKEVVSYLDANYFKGLYNHQARTGVMEVRPVLTLGREEKRQNGRRMKDPGEPMFTLTAQDKHGIYDGYRIRKLTPRECWRLQGFPDWAFDQAKLAGVSDSQLYKQAGNSVTVNVIYEIAKRLVE